MKCPLKEEVTNISMSVGPYTVKSDKCIEKECAWWYENGNLCAILQISKDLYMLEDDLHIRREHI
jgi:hypothetical protein